MSGFSGFGVPSVLDGLVGDGVHAYARNAYQQSAQQAYANAQYNAHPLAHAANSNRALDGYRNAARPPLTEDEQEFIARIRRKMAILEQQLRDDA